MQISEKKEKLKRIFVFFCYLCIVYCGLLHIHYGTDTYFNYFKSNVDWQLQVGRYSIYVVAKLFEILHISLVKYQQIFTLISFLLLAISGNIFFDLVKEKRKNINSYLLMLLICLGFGNVISTELFLFPEYAIYNSLGIFFAFVSIWLFSLPTKIATLYSTIVLIVSLGFYQTNIGTFIIVTILVIWFKLKDNDKFPIGSLVKFIIVAGVSSIANIAIKKIFILSGVAEETVRDATLSVNTIINNIKSIWEAQYNILINGDDFLPKYMMLVFIMAMIIILYIGLVRKKFKPYMIILTTFFILAQYASVYAPHLIAGSVWLSPRTITPLFIFNVSISIMALSCVSADWKKIGAIYKIALFVFVIFNIYGIQGIVQNHIATNKIDQEYAYNIYCEILRYENETGITINNISAVNDEIPRWKNRFIEYYSYNVNERSYINDWSDVELINFISGKQYTEIQMDENIFNDNFKGKNWEYYCPEEQLYFQDDTLYWCKY